MEEEEGPGQIQAAFRLTVVPNGQARPLGQVSVITSSVTGNLESTFGAVPIWSGTPTVPVSKYGNTRTLPGSWESFRADGTESHAATGAATARAITTTKPTLRHFMFGAPSRRDRWDSPWRGFQKTQRDHLLATQRVHCALRKTPCLSFFRRSSILSIPQVGSPEGLAVRGSPADYVDGSKRSVGRSLRFGHDDFPYNRRAGGHPRLAHDQAQKGLHRVRADIHPTRNLLGAQAVKQILQHIALAAREVELLGNERHGDQAGGSPFEQDGDAGVRGTTGAPIHEEDAAEVTAPARPELGHKARLP